MKKQNVLFSIFAISCWICPAFSQKDTVHFIPGTTKYNLVLKGEEQYFIYDTIRHDKRINYYSELWIKNNSSKTILINTVRTNSSGKMLVDLMEPDRYEEIKPGKSFCILIRPNLNRPGMLNAWASIFYKTGKEEKELKVQVRGYTLPMPQSTDPPILVEAQEPKQVNPPIKIKKPVKQPEIQEPVKIQPTYTPRPEGVIRFDLGELVLRQENQQDYSFTFHTAPEEYASGFFSKPKKDLVFSWDTITDQELSCPMMFHLKNASEYLVTILKIGGNDGTVYYRNTQNQVVVFPDSSIIIEAIPNLFQTGHFYHSLIIDYQSYYGIKQFELKQWGYIPIDRETITSSDSLKLVGLRNTFYEQKNKSKVVPIQLYVAEGGQSIYQDARLKLFSKESTAIIQSETDAQGNRFFQIHRNGWDTLLIQVLSPKNEVLQKMRLVDPFKYDSYSIPFFTFTGPYTYNHLKSPYKKLDGIYWLEQERDHFLYPDQAIIKKYIGNIPIRFLKNGTVEITNFEDAITLEKKLFQSPLKIRLLPVSEPNSGNGITWYSNTFTVMFYEHVSEEQIKKIFAKYHIAHYNKQNYGYKSENNWTFSMEYILDRKYMVLLDQLWQLKEVSGIIQEKREIEGSD